MSFLLLYGLLLKATLSSFNGLAALPIIRQDLVVARHILTDRQLNTAVAIGRTTPGPIGVFIVSIGYYAAGFPGAVAGWLALVTPALLVIPLMVFARRYVTNLRIQRTLRAVVLASAGISLSATLPLAADALHTPISYLLAAASFMALLFTKIDTLWVILGAAMVPVLLLALGLL